MKGGGNALHKPLSVGQSSIIGTRVIPDAYNIRIGQTTLELYLGPSPCSQLRIDRVYPSQTASFLGFYIRAPSLS